jgi:phosphocarrier protein HPr
MPLPFMSAKKFEDDSESMTRDFIVSNKLGIHARPAAMFVKVANRFKCNIFVEKDGEKVNGKSIMGLMMLAAGPGSKVKVYAEGNDASQALEELESLVDRKFGEE